MGAWEIFTRNGGTSGMGGGGGGGGGGGFIMEGWGIFKSSLQSWQRGANPSIL